MARISIRCSVSHRSAVADAPKAAVSAPVQRTVSRGPERVPASGFAQASATPRQATSARRADAHRTAWTTMSNRTLPPVSGVSG